MDPNEKKEDGLEGDNSFFEDGITKFPPEAFTSVDADYPDNLKKADLPEYLLYSNEGEKEEN
jgi:hypothetical protein